MKDETALAELGKTINLDYFEEWPNFGDRLSRSLVEKLTGGMINVSPYSCCDLTAVGSLFFLTENFFSEQLQEISKEEPVHIWGSGFLDGKLPKKQLYPTRQMEVHAVRGKKTLEILKALGCVAPDREVVLGDPGLFYTDLFEGITDIPKVYDLAIVPHRLDSENFRELTEQLSEQGINVKFIDVRQDNPFQVVREIASARKVLASSLHAIIVSDALGIPHKRLLADGFMDSKRHVTEQSFFKFEDYYSAFGLEAPSHVTEQELRERPSEIIEKIGEKDCVPGDLIRRCKQNLLEAFPYPIAPTWEGKNGISVSSSVKLSVIIPEYNNEFYLHDCMVSILGQKDFVDFEVILIDDGSTDGSLQRMRQWAELDSRVRVFTQENSGPGIARNQGIQQARGKYMMFLDSDDRLAGGEALKAAYEQAEREHLDILLTDALNIDSHGQYFPGEYCPEEFLPSREVFCADSIGNQLAIFYNLAPWGKIYRTDFIKEQEIQFAPLKRSEDYPFVVVAGMLAKRVGVLKENLVCHRVAVPTSLENTKDQTPLIFMEGDAFMKKELVRRELYEKCKDIVGMQVYRRVCYCLGRMQSFDSFLEVVKKVPEIYEEYALESTSLLRNYKQYMYNKEYLENILFHMNSEQYLYRLYEKHVSPVYVSHDPDVAVSATKLATSIPGQNATDAIGVELRKTGVNANAEVSFVVEKDGRKIFYPVINHAGERQFLTKADIAKLQKEMRITLSEEEQPITVELRRTGKKGERSVSFVVNKDGEKKIHRLFDSKGNRNLMLKSDMEALKQEIEELRQLVKQQQAEIEQLKSNNKKEQ